MDRRHFLRAAPATLFVLAGCTGNGQDQGGTDPSEDGNQTTTAESEGGDTDLPDTVPVALSGTEFDPRQVRIAPGGSVTWTNEGSNQHTVEATTFTEEGTSWSFRSDTLSSGDSSSHTFEQGGVYEYYCTIHGESSMCGVVLVGDVSYSGSLPCEDDGGGGFY